MNIIHNIKSIFTKNPEEEQVLETIEDIIEQREERGEKTLVDPHELLLLKNLFKLRELRAEDIMIPRVDIVGISVSATAEDLKKVVTQNKFTRIPVYEKTLDNVVGVLHAKRLLCAFLNKEPISIPDIMTDAVLFVSPAIRAMNLLTEMQKKKLQIAVVVDEHGGTDGLVTLEDLLEVIVGEIEDEHDAQDKQLLLKKINRYVIDADAKVDLYDLQKLTGQFLTAEEDEMDLDTVGGLVFHIAGRLPTKGEIVVHSTGIQFLVTDADKCHIKRVRISHFKGTGVSAGKKKCK